MPINRISRTTVKFTGKTWGIKFLTAKEKKDPSIPNLKLSKTELNKKRFELLINKLDQLQEESVIVELYGKFDQLEFAEKQKLRNSVRSRKTKMNITELILLIDNNTNKPTIKEIKRKKINIARIRYK